MFWLSRNTLSGSHSFERNQPLGLGVAVDRRRPLIRLGDVVHVAPGGRERRRAGHGRSAPLTARIVQRRIVPLDLRRHPEARCSPRERGGVLRNGRDRTAPGPGRIAAVRASRYLGDVLDGQVDELVRERMEKRALHVEAVTPLHRLVVEALGLEVRLRIERAVERRPEARSAARSARPGRGPAVVGRGRCDRLASGEPDSKLVQSSSGPVSTVSRNRAASSRARSTGWTTVPCVITPSSGLRRNVKDVAIPKFAPAPRRPQKSSGFSSSLARTRRPSAVTSSTSRRLSIVSPCFRCNRPIRPRA